MTNRIRAVGTYQDGISGPIDRLSDKVNRLQMQGAKGLAIGVAAGATTAALNILGGAVGGVTDFMGRAMERASDLSESMGKSEVVFGRHAAGMERWADTAGESFGQSKQQALEAAGTYGNLFQAFGVGQDQAAGMSKRLVELAADMASFNNTSIDDALIALRSGLSGETEPLKRYGIAISDARMRTALMEQGVTDLGATLTPLQKSTAAYTLILKDSSLAQGDFARTADGVANSIRINEAAIRDLEAEIGEKAIPIQKEWLRLQRDMLGALGGVITVTDGSEKSVGDLTDAYRDMLGVLPPLLRDLTGVDDALDTVSDALAVTSHMADATKDDLTSLGQKPNLRPLTGDVKDLAAAAKEAERKVDSLADELIDHLFGEAARLGRRQEITDSIKDLEKQLAKTKDKGDARILRGDIAELEGQLMELDLQIATLEGDEALSKLLDRWERRFDRDNLKAQFFIDRLRELLGLTKRFPGSIPSGFRQQTGSLADRHSGGPVQAGVPYVVRPDEEVFIPDSHGRVEPFANAAIGTTGGGGLTINIHGVSVLTPGSAEALAKQIVPAISREQQRLGLIPRRA